MIKTVIIAIPVLLIGGTEVQTLKLVSVLIIAGYKVVVCCYYEYDREMVKHFEGFGAEVLLMNYDRTDGLWHLAKGLMKLFSRKKPDIVHVQYIAPGLVPIVAAKIAGVKTVFATVHQTGRVYGRQEKLLLRTAAGFCSAFFCVSRSVEKSWFGDSELFAPQKVNNGRRHFTVYNGVDVEKIEKVVKEMDGQALKQSLGIEGKKVVGIVGRLREEKGQTVLLDAMAEVIKTIPAAMLMVVGDGPDRMNLELRAKSLGLASNILWLGQKSPEEVYQLYSIMDVVTVPSLFEGFGFVAAEAMAAGLPVVGTRVDGLTEVIENDVTGLLVYTGDSAALASALTDILSDREKAREMGQKGRKRVRELFPMEKFGKAILSAYRELA